MSKGPQLRICFVRVCLGIFIVTNAGLLAAQVPPPNKLLDQASSPQKEPDASKPPAPEKEPFEDETAPQSKRSGKRVAIERTDRQRGRVSVPVARGVRLLLDNRTTGRITVHGWNRDTVEAHALSERGEEVVVFGQSEDASDKAVFLKADYLNLDDPTTPTQELDSPPVGKEGPIQVHLEVSVPRYIELELIRVMRSNVEIVGVDTPLIVVGKSSNVTLKDVRSAEVQTRTGSITIENAQGIADVSSSTGSISVVNSRGAVRAVSIIGAIEVKCFKGRVDVGNTQGPIELIGIEGDVEAIAASSDVRLTGQLSSDGRYYLKSMSGRVEMFVPGNTPGFNAMLTSYRGKVESDFLLRPRPTASDPEAESHRRSGRFGNGGPQITLDSFEGLVKLGKLAGTATTTCQ